ncbi:uncharacterized protein EDB91DRAFT_1085213 [Suillus paluster]|uniref:uncharacterized protein n=1 Tax=Suillus paluster TaxID=48578 RepID=UPI001B8627D8|nr:uncharacterized protein EDB91DRAFT_1085213 [Suillus paluster]KAG1731101.1 hypothetical protein EDB91DRAFT_1085213 [Suillus paluster]
MAGLWREKLLSGVILRDISVNSALTDTCHLLASIKRQMDRCTVHIPHSQSHFDLRSTLRQRAVLGQFYLVFMVQGVLVWTRMGLTYAPSIAVTSQRFSKRCTLVMSLVTSGTPLGAMIRPIMLNYLFNATAGFARGVRVSAGFLLFILMTVGIILFIVNSQLDLARFIGRCTIGLIAAYTGVLNLAIISTVTCSAVIISMIALSDMASVVVLGLTYACVLSGLTIIQVIALVVPLLTVLTPNLSELGARVGICFAFTEREWSAVGGLLGGPTSGAVLSSQHKWWIPSLFSGASSWRAFA